VYSLYVLGLLIFVATLKPGHLHYQFRIFGEANLVVVLMTVPISLLYFNIYEGICWFMVPCSLIITNDICAYLVGYFFGKTKLISLSPKKTVEGFLGGAVCTLFAALAIAWVIEFSPALTCSQHQLQLVPFQLG
jgi:phosphatidate cytidylyltransferase